jgi:hypothetical protein
VIPTSETALRQALFREANCLAPCRESKNQKIGSRDAAIWLSTVEYANKHVEETVYFVSANTKDFGDGVSYPYPMNQDIAHMGDRFVLLTSVDDVAARFTEPAEADRALITEITKSEAVLKHAEEAANAILSARAYPFFDCSIPLLDGGSMTIPASFWLTERAHFGSVGEVQAYRIDDHEWCTASVEWHLAGLVHTELLGAISAVVRWPTVMLLSLNRENPRPSLLREANPRPVNDETAALFASLPRYHPTDVERAKAKTIAAERGMPAFGPIPQSYGVPRSYARSLMRLVGIDPDTSD